MPTMAIAIVLIYDESRHLIPKPADYTTLISVARAKFRELYRFADGNTTFHFTPEWYDGEVQIDGGAFSEVHDRAVLRITTAGSARAQSPRPDIEDQDSEVLAQGPTRSPIKHESVSPVSSRKHLMPIMVRYRESGEVYRCHIDPDDSLGGLVDDASDRFFVAVDELLFRFEGQEFDGYDTPHDLDMEPGDTVDVTFVG